MLAKNTSQLMLMRLYYKRLLQSLYIYSVLSHSDKTDDYWHAFICENRNVWRMVHYLMPQMVCKNKKKTCFFSFSVSDFFFCKNSKFPMPPLQIPEFSNSKFQNIFWGEGTVPNSNRIAKFQEFATSRKFQKKTQIPYQ